MKIGVFDSGKGGEFIAAGLEKLLPEHEYIVVNDREHVPYGSRSDKEVIALTMAAIQPLLTECSIIVIACNTATMAAIAPLRTAYPAIKFIGIEPMIKPAAILSATGHIAILATPLTLKSQRYRQLVSIYANGTTISEPDTKGWAAAVEYGQVNEIDLDELGKNISHGCDVIVLACTHYLALQPKMVKEFPHVTVLEPTEAIARQITVLAAR